MITSFACYETTALARMLAQMKASDPVGPQSIQICIKLLSIDSKPDFTGTPRPTINTAELEKVGFTASVSCLCCV